jgi:hypothetical protein
MSSGSRTFRVSPGREKRKELTKIYYPPPNEKQFIAYSFVIKESGLGVTSHERLLLFDSMHKTLRYYSKAPDPLPTPSEPLPEGKETITIKGSKSFEFRSIKAVTGKTIIKWTENSGQKKSWLMTFKNNYLMNDWVIFVNEAIKDGHLHSDLRPRSSSRRSTSRDLSRYYTPFMKETGGVSYSGQNNSSSSAWNSESDTKQNRSWITEKVK